MLEVVRLLHTLVTGRVLSPCAAVRWALEVAEPEWARVLSESLRALGANVENGVPMLSHVRVDRGLITGQNPKSSRKAAERLVEALAAPRAH